MQEYWHEGNKITVCQGMLSAGQGTTNCTSVDMKGFDEVTFIILAGAITAGGTMTFTAQASSNNSSFAALSHGAAAMDGDDDDLVGTITIQRPKGGATTAADRYLRISGVRATQNGQFAVIAIQSKAKDKPVTQPASGSVFNIQALSPADA